MAPTPQVEVIGQSILRNPHSLLEQAHHGTTGDAGRPHHPGQETSRPETRVVESAIGVRELSLGEDQKRDECLKTVCPTCKSEFIQKTSRGRTRRYCSDLCRNQPPRSLREKKRVGRTWHKLKCEQCGVEFQSLHPRKRMCGLTCSNKWNANRVQKHFDAIRPTYTCEHCGKQWQPKLHQGTSRRAFRFCSRQCAAIVNGQKLSEAARVANTDRLIGKWSPVEFAVCGCGKVFRIGQKKRHCSFECGYAATLQRLRVKGTVVGTCLECGTEFRADRGKGPGKKHAGAKYCSTKCVLRVDRRIRKVKEKYGIERSDRIHFRAVWDRDGGRCYICNTLCYLNHKVPHPLAPTLEHKFPLSLGGENTMANAGIAHFICNCFKGNYLDPMFYRVWCIEAVAAIERGEDGWKHWPTFKAAGAGDLSATSEAPSAAAVACKFRQNETSYGSQA